jgi:hypothetical protein
LEAAILPLGSFEVAGFDAAGRGIRHFYDQRDLTSGSGRCSHMERAVTPRAADGSSSSSSSSDQSLKEEGRGDLLEWLRDSPFPLMLAVRLMFTI